MTMERTCGEAIVSLLEAYGIDTAFGIPGVHTLDFYRGLENSTMRVVTARHEQGAGFMADGYARVSGRPAACLVITGPGVTNIATAVGQAYSDSVPMLVIASVNETEHLGMGRGRLHEITNQRDTIAPLTGFSATAFSPDDVPPLLTRAYAVFDSQRPRPVYIEVPLDVMAAPASFAPHNRPAMPRPTPSAEAVAEAVDLIRGARRPAIIAGGGAQDDGPRLLALAELLGAAVVLTTAGKGAVSEDHPLCVGSSLAEPETRALLAGSDLVIAIGTELAETDTWHERLEFGGKLIRIDIDSHMLYGDYLPDAALLGDAGSALGLLLAALNSNGVQRADPTGESGFQAAREDWRSALSPKRRKHAAVLDALRDALPEDGFIFSDATQIGYTGNAYYRCRRPRSWFHPVGYCTLGQAMPAAIGGKLAAPSRPGVALVGDGGFMFTVQELATAVELGLPLAVVVWNNDGLGQIRDDMVERGIAEIGVNRRNPDFLALAEAFGCAATRPESLDDFKKELLRAFAADRPTLIEVREDAPFLS